MRARVGWPLHLLWLGTALWAPPASAEEPEMPPPGMEAIEVTGERLDTADVQDEAQAISAFSGEDLDRANIVNVDSLAQSVPGLHVGQQGNQAIITLRGIGTTNASITGEPGVQFHVDGLNYARPSAARVAFFDIEALRVVRGPYGTSGGKNATGGAILLETRKPTDEFGFEGNYEIGSYDQQRVRGAVNLPLLPERMAGRFAFIGEEHTGYQTNLNAPDEDDRADDADNFGLRSHLRFNPTDAFEALLSYNYYRADGVGPGAKLVGDPTTVRCLAPDEFEREFKESKATRFIFPRESQRRPPTPAERARFRLQEYRNARGEYKTEEVLPFTDGTYYLRKFFNDRAQVTRHTDKAWCADLNSNYISTVPPTEDPMDARLVYLDQQQEQTNRIWGWGTNLAWDLPEIPWLGAARLTALGGFQGTSLSDPRDFDTTDLPFFSLTTVENDSQQYSSELRLESAEGERLDWTAGLYYQRETSELIIDGLTFGNAFGIGIDQDFLVKSYAGYGELDFHLTDALTLTTGARLSHDYKYTRLLRANGSNLGEAGSPGEKTCLTSTETQALAQRLKSQGRVLRDDVPTCEDRWQRWTGGAGLEWRPLDAHLLYVQFDKGYKAGTYIVGDYGKVDPEIVYAYTAGSKSEFFDGRLQMNVEAFYYKYEDYHVVEIDGLSLRTENAPEVRTFGLETEFNAELYPGLRLNGQAGYLNSEVVEYETIDPMTGLGSLFRDGKLAADQLQDLSGNEMPRSPKFKYMVALEYAMPIDAWGTLTPRVQYYWQDETYYRVFNTPYDHQDAYHKTDLKLIWTSPEEMWTAEAFVDNIEDADVFQNLIIGSEAIGSPALAYYAPPRLYGFRVGFRY